jgi:hypothetical protein
MTFEDTLREQLHRQADDLPLPPREPGRAVARARARRRHHRVAAGATAVVALLAAVVAPQLAGGSGDGDDSATAGPADGGAGLPLTGPLAFDWQATDGGLTSVSSAFQADDGTVYALATGPGVRYEDHPNGDYPRALYRLAEDGTWEAVPLEGERPDALDVATAGGLLYAVSTGPDGNGGYGPLLSTSADGGDSWTVEDVGAIDPPSDVIPWLKSSTLAIDSNGDTTLALVSTSFRPNQEAVFPQLREPDGYSRYQAMPREDGFALVDASVAAPRGDVPAEEDLAAALAEARAAARGEATASQEGTSEEWRFEDSPQTTGPTTTAPPSTAAPTSVVEGTIVPPVEGDGPLDRLPYAGAEVVQLVPWADLGVSGIEALGAHHQVFQRVGDEWQALDATGLPVDGFGLELTVAGNRFLATGYATLSGESVAYASSDGVSWAPVSAPDPQVVGVGSALVSLPYEGTVVHVSPDGGATWSEVDLASVGVAPGSFLADADSGPLGLALVSFPANGAAGAQLVVSGDLVDWTVTPMEQVLGTGDEVSANVVVGADRVVVTASTAPADPTALPGTLTAVGTPVRQD